MWIIRLIPNDRHLWLTQYLYTRWLYINIKVARVKKIRLRHELCTVKWVLSCLCKQSILYIFFFLLHLYILIGLFVSVMITCWHRGVATKHVLTLSIRLYNIHPLDEKLLELRFNCFWHILSQTYALYLLLVPVIEVNHNTIISAIKSKYSINILVCIQNYISLDTI